MKAKDDKPEIIGSAEGWTKRMGFHSLYEVTLSPDGKWVAILSHAKGALVDLPATNNNTLYVLDAHTGEVALRSDFLKGTEFDWADQAFQTHLVVEFAPRGGGSLTVSGVVTTGAHPEKVGFQVPLPIPPIHNLMQ